MKIHQTLFCFFALLFSSTVMAQDTSSQKTALILKTDLLLPVVGIDPGFSGGSLTVELGVNRRHSFQLTGLMAHFMDDETHNKSIQIIPEYKYFLSKKRAYTGFYSGVYLKCAQYHHTWDYTLSPENYYLEQTENTVSEGLLVGYQNYIKKRIVFDVLFGAGINQVLSTKTIQSDNVVWVEIESSNIDFIFALNIGYKF